MSFEEPNHQPRVISYDAPQSMMPSMATAMAGQELLHRAALQSQEEEIAKTQAQLQEQQRQQEEFLKHQQQQAFSSAPYYAGFPGMPMMGQGYYGM